MAGKPVDTIFGNLFSSFIMQEGSLVLKCFQLLADALNQILTLEQVLVPNFHKQIEAMLKSMSESKVCSLALSLP